MATKLKIPFTENIDLIFKKALQESQNHEGKFSGNKYRGDFDFKALGGRFTGNYQVSGNLIEVIFTNKPFLVWRF
ncbi:hypothetical protein [Mucilaginibacter lacusdianchii]|uniref:hypothetical protein n=1 Tax=Mucilaginibacter lacusdianchii TaxID=2684211 RepID=UPI00131E2C3C|nr:hypothetical protein [Mucilaginibacter sp. JXJ CY 39]